MTQPNLSDTLIQILSSAKQLFKQAGTTSPAEDLITNRPTLQENEVIRIELYAEVPQLHRQVIQENVPIKQSIKQYLAEHPTD